MLSKLCNHCGNKFYKKATCSKKDWDLKSKYCSTECSRFNTCFVKGHIPWSKGKKGMHFSPESEFKKGQTANDKNVNWKGSKVGYFALHNWVSRKFGKPCKCEDCGSNDKNKIYQWANISNNYLRDRSDWKRLCISCHKKLDSALLARGESHGMSILNNEKVKLIRMMNSYFDWDVSKIYNLLGKPFGITIHAIKDVLSRKSWCHI